MLHGPRIKKSAFNAAEIRHPVNRVAEAREQVEPRRPTGGIGIVDRDGVEERIDGPPQAGERGHSRSEILRGQRTRGRRLGCVERGDKRSFLRFGRVGKRFVALVLQLRGDHRGEIGIVDQAERVFLPRAGDALGIERSRIFGPGSPAQAGVSVGWRSVT